METDPSANGPRVPPGIGPLLRDLVHERTGIHFEDTRIDDLLEKMKPLATGRGCGSLLDYYYLLKDQADGPQWDQLWEALSVPETYFWRETAQVDALTRVLVPRWFKDHSGPFRIWSAACASGEEPYSIAIALEESGLGSHPIEITASDACEPLLEKARRGIYREKSLRALPLHLRAKYFQKAEGGWELSPGIVSKVKWRRANLLNPGEVASLARAQTVFCRNVFIYFSPHSIRVAVAMMASKMPRKACLFVGATESLLRMTTDFELTEIGDALGYVRI